MEIEREREGRVSSLFMTDCYRKKTTKRLEIVIESRVVMVVQKEEGRVELIIKKVDSTHRLFINSHPWTHEFKDDREGCVCVFSQAICRPYARPPVRFVDRVPLFFCWLTQE